MPQPIVFFFAFVVVLALIGAAAWLVRRFAGNRLGANANRGRMPRLAVIDAAAVDGRRRLVLVRRDNVEHLLMIGGPTDIVVEPNIVRAMPARDQAPPRPSVGGAELPPRVALPDVGSWADSDAAPDHPEPAMPEPPPRPSRPSFADEVRRPAPALSERRSDPLAGFTPEPMSRTDIREPAPPAGGRAQRADHSPSLTADRTAEAASGPRPGTCRGSAASAVACPFGGRSESRRDGAAARSRTAPPGRRFGRAPCRRAAGGPRAAAEPARATS